MELNFCPNCFDHHYQNGSCLRCGYQVMHAKKRNQKALPAGVILKKRYYVGKLLGVGGFGITYKAFDLEKKQICAIKEYVPDDCAVRSSDKRNLEPVAQREDHYLTGLKRFSRETRLLSYLEQIPSVVDITDAFQENGTAYFTMEYLEGADLQQIVQDSPKQLSVKEAVDIILQVALSMDVIHAKTKIIHRDISPENVYITKDRKVKLIDFGSANQTENGFGSGLSVVVKLKFAPPEQYSADMIQGSFTDVYALAGTYYYVQTGMYLPSAPDRLSGKDYVPLKLMNIGVPDGISDAIDHALALNVNQRTRTMQQFVREISAGIPAGWIQNAPRPVPQPVPKPVPKPVHVVAQGQVAIPYVKVIAGTDRGKNWVIPSDQAMKIGRFAPEVNLWIQAHDRVSRIHCQVEYLSAKRLFCIQDTSTNGTSCNGKELKKGVKYEVTPPARLSLADSSNIIEVGVNYEYH